MSDVQIAVIDQQDTQIALAVPGVQGAVGATGPTGPTGPAGIPVVASGTTAAPAISFVSDLDTGINNNAPNQLALVAGGQNVLLVDANGITAVDGDIELDDGGTFSTTLQTVTPTANRTISFPDATGTVALVAGSSGQLLYNASGANAGTSTITYDGTNVTLSGRFISSLNGAASAPPGTFTGTWFTGGTSTTTKPQVVIEPTGTTSTSWSTCGTGLGVNAASGFVGNLLDLQINGTSRAVVTGAGRVGIGTTSPAYALDVASSGKVFANSGFRLGTGYSAIDVATGATGLFLSGAEGVINHVFINPSGRVGIGTGSPSSLLHLADAGNITVGTTTGTKIGTATTQKIGFYNATPVVQPAAVANITTTATAGTLPTADGTVTIADAATPTVTELLEYCVELESKLEAALGHLRTLGLIAT